MTAGWVAIALGLVSVATMLSLLLFFIVGGPFGSLNDAGNALIGLLSVALALLLVGNGGAWLGVAAAVAGAGLVTWGSWLVMSGSTGFVLAGFVTTVGFGLIGAWLALVAWGPGAAEWSEVLRGMTRVAAVAMIAGGVVAVAGSLMRVDAYEGMPSWLWLFSVGWLGVYVLYPIVAIALGRRLIGA